MNDLKQFAANMRKAANKSNPDSVIAAASDEKLKRVAAAFLQNVVNLTPVDTSLAVSNWRVEIGRMPTLATHDIRTAHFYGSGGSTANASRERAIALGLEAIKTKKPGEPIYIYNMLPYIRKLDGGHSTQQAAGFVGRARLAASKVE